MKKSDIIHTLDNLKQQSGSHSISIDTLLGVPGIKVGLDACFLSNPYATDLFMNYCQQDLIRNNALRHVLEFYPPQVRDVSKYLSVICDVKSENIFVGNGAIEIIQAVLHSFVKQNICVILPTFSPYYEFVNSETQVFFYHTKKEDNFELDVDDYLSFLIANDIKNIVIVNPNNPDGSYLQSNRLLYLLQNCQHLNTIILDESFVHFAIEDDELTQVKSEKLIMDFPNLVLIKSMSKDFGIAGIRAGYGVMSKDRVDSLLKNGYLWNISGLAAYFFKLYSSENFRRDYNIVRKKYIMNTKEFFVNLSKLTSYRVYPSQANFALLELMGGKSSKDFVMDLLIDEGIYLRDCSDKLGLEGEFVRVASRSFEENLILIESLSKLK